jgi:hypothetical protein
LSELFRFFNTRERDPDIDAWFLESNHEMRRIAQPWFEEMRRQGPDIRELLHDGWPTACAGDAAFAYVSAFNAHANIGFYFGAALDDPHGLLEGAGKRMRHVKLRWGETANAEAVRALIAEAYRDIQKRLAAEHRVPR